MDTITVRVSELFELVSKMHQDGMDYAQIMLIEADDGEPGFASLSAIKASEPDMVVDYESVDDLPEADALFDAGIGFSSNLH